ncbi:solute:sodium symporter family transporter [Pasteurellaceae bacterium LIM206]|nr:solute:sodium symporter family transporter [Pasteurellaceae bacterium LIM206]
MFFTIFSFLAIVIGIWIFAWWKTKNINKRNLEGYFLSGRSLGAIVIAGTMLMANLSTEQIVGQNGLSYSVGMEVMAWEVIACFSVLILALIFLPNYMKHGVSTIPEFLAIRFDNQFRQLVSFFIQTSYAFILLPGILYSGSLVFNQLFGVSEILGISQYQGVMILGAIIGIVGLSYLLIGGMGISAVSDAIYSVGLLIGGLTIPIIALYLLGDGEITAGLSKVIETAPHKLNAFGAINSKAVPWPTLMLGLFFNTMFYWNTNQFIVQKTMAGRSLAEGQKGVIYLAFFKLLGPLFLVFPGVIAFVMFNGELPHADGAYPALVREVLPSWAYGIFGAIIFGTILSTYTAALNSVSTLFAYDFYKGLYKPQAREDRVVTIGKVLNIIISIISIILAPILLNAPTGIYNFLQEYVGFYNIPLIVIILFGFFNSKVSAKGAKLCFFFHLILYVLAKITFTDLHFLYIHSVLFFLDIFVIWLSTKYYQRLPAFEFTTNANKVDLTPWKYRKIAACFVVLGVISLYLIFSPLGIAV